MVTPALAIENVDVHFGGLKAVDAISLSANPSSVTGLIGPNGAGKTTLFNVITGFLRPDSGDVFIRGRRVTHMPAHARARLGLGRTFQRLEMFASLSVRDNIRVAAEAPRRAFQIGWRPQADPDEIIARVGLSAVSATQVDRLSTGTIRLVEIARALAMRPSVLLLDEPSAGLDRDERERLAVLLDELSNAGLSILLVEHDIEFVVRVCSHIHVMDLGRLIAEGSPTGIQVDPVVKAAYLGNVGIGQADSDESSPS